MNNTQNEAFVYLWRDNLYKKYYLGIHKGSVTDGYISSSVFMMPEYNKRPNDFSRRILKFGTHKKMIKLETKLLKSRIKRFGKQYYNASCGSGIIYTNDVRKKMSKNSSRYWLGKTHSKESKQKMSNTLKGRTFSEETRKKMSKAQKGKNNPMWGKTLSQEVRDKISQAAKGKNNPIWGKPRSEETKKKISEAMKAHRKNKQQGNI